MKNNQSTKTHKRLIEATMGRKRRALTPNEKRLKTENPNSITKEANVFLGGCFK